jgi:hypothetical protein
MTEFPWRSWVKKKVLAFFGFMYYHSLQGNEGKE